MTEKTKCPICNNISELHDVVDFNKNCEENKGFYLPLSGIPVYYSHCNSCNYLFAPEFLNWSDNDFLQRIYNIDYEKVDPDYQFTRPQNNAGFINKLFHDSKTEIRHLDYGGGNGLMSEILLANDFDSQSFDPFPSSIISLDQLGRFNLITAFEVFEHVPYPLQLMKNIIQLMDDKCLFLFSTLTIDRNIKKNERINWWYCSPRNGHISLYSKNSLALLAKKHNLLFGSFNDGLHFFSNIIPNWATRLIHVKENT
jgi:hypothetical protein